MDAGASADGRHLYGGRYGTHTDAAIYNGNDAAAEYLIERGAVITLSTALCLERWTDVDRLIAAASDEEKQDAFVQAALRGKPAALQRMLRYGVPSTTSSRQNQSHGTALHHAVWSGSLEAVKVLVQAGADLNRRDTIYRATPLGWATYAIASRPNDPHLPEFQAIADYLRSSGGAP